MGERPPPPTSAQSRPDPRGEMGRRVREHDWAATTLGPADTWPAALRLVVNLVLDSRQPRFVVWGPDLISIYNDGYIPILGDKHPAALARPFREIWAEIWDEYGPLVEATLRGDAQYFIDQPVALTGRAGRPISWFTFSWTPVRDADGRVAGLLSVATETTEKVLAQQALKAAQEELLRRNEQRYRQLFDSIDQGFCIIEMIFDAAGQAVDYRFVEVNNAFERQTGLTGVVGRTMRSLTPGHEQHWFDTYGRVARTGEAERFELPAAQLGRYFEVYAFRIGPAEDRQVAVLFNDIAERKQAETHQNLLLAELDHRVKNVLAVVQSIVRQSLRGGDAADRERLGGRLSALARSHRLLADSRWEGAVLRHLIADTVAAYRGGEPDRLTLTGPGLKVVPKAAQSLTLAFHELTTNAAKYGALSRSTGTVSIDWKMEGTGRSRQLVLAWRETGGPHIESPPDRQGFGSRLIAQTVSYELGGTVDLDFRPSGLVATMRLPLDALVDSEPAPPEPRTAALTPAAGTPAPLPLAGKRILVAEDQYLVAAEIGAAIEDAGGIVVGPMPTLRLALQAAETETIDAASLDVNLNGEMIWPAAAALRRRGIPLVLVTGYASSLEAPADLAGLPRIEKPVNARLIIDYLRRLLGEG